MGLILPRRSLRDSADLWARFALGITFGRVRQLPSVPEPNTLSVYPYGTDLGHAKPVVSNCPAVSLDLGVWLRRRKRTQRSEEFVRDGRVHSSGAARRLHPFQRDD